MKVSQLERMTQEANILLSTLEPASVEQKGAAKCLGIILWFLDSMCVYSRNRDDIPGVLARSWTAIIAFLPEFMRADTVREQNDVMQRMSKVVADRQ